MMTGIAGASNAYETIGGHAGGACAVTYSPDGAWLASGGGDALVKVWQPGNKQPVRQMIGHVSTVTSVAYSPDGTLIVSGSADSTIKLWNVSAGRMVYSIKADTTVASVAFSPDGQTIASGDYANKVRLWQASNGREIKTLTGHTSRVLSVKFSPDGKTLASGSVDATIKLWDMAAGASQAKLRSTLRGHSAEVQALAFFRDGVLASTSIDRTVRLWDVTACTPIGIGVLPSSWACLGFHSIAVSPDGTKLATGSDDSCYMVWWERASRGGVAVKGTLSINGDDTTGMCFSNDSSRLVTSSADSTLKMATTYEVDSNAKTR
jgi:WD40 repeat protein